MPESGHDIFSILIKVSYFKATVCGYNKMDTGRWLLIAALALLTCALTGCDGAEENANSLYVSSAERIEKGIQTTDPKERYDDFSQALQQTEKIIKEYGKTTVAVKVAGNEKIGKLTLEELKAAVRAAEADPVVCFMHLTSTCLKEGMKQEVLSLAAKVKNGTASPSESKEFRSLLEYVLFLDESSLNPLANVFGEPIEKIRLLANHAQASFILRVAAAKGLEPALQIVRKVKEAKNRGEFGGDDPLQFFSIRPLAYVTGLDGAGLAKELCLF